MKLGQKVIHITYKQGAILVFDKGTVCIIHSTYYAY